METQKLRKAGGTDMCEIFFCDRRGERYCCYHCPGKKECKNPCVNNPEKCGKHFIQERRKERNEA